MSAYSPACKRRPKQSCSFFACKAAADHTFTLARHRTAPPVIGWRKTLNLFGLNFDRRSKTNRLRRPAGYFNRAAPLQVSRDHGWFRPIEIPTIVDGEHGIGSRHNSLQAEGPIEIALIASEEVRVHLRFFGS